MLRMNRSILGTSIVLCCLGAFAPAVRGEEGLWQTDFDAAKAKAKAEKKLLLVDFTGSDWCVWCKKLKSEVFDKDEFKTEAPKHFVLVELDYPHEKELSADLKSQNEKLAKQYKIKGFPTVLLLDAEGEVIAHTGYKEGGSEEYVKQLSGFLDSYATIVKMKDKLPSTKGIERAKLLDKIVEAYVKLNNEMDQLAEWSKEIVKLDSDNKAGLKVKHQFRICLTESRQFMEDRKFAKAKAGIEKALAIEGITAAQKQTAYMAAAAVCSMQKDIAGLVKSLQHAVDADPDSPQAAQAKATVERFKPIVEAMEKVAKLRSELDDAKGLDRAKLLDKLIEAQIKIIPLMPTADAIQEIDKWTAEIVSLDSENKAGLKSKYEFRLKVRELAQQLRSKDFAKARTTLDEMEALPGLSDDQKAMIEQARKRLPKEKDKDGGKDN